MLIACELFATARALNGKVSSLSPSLSAAKIIRTCLLGWYTCRATLQKVYRGMLQCYAVPPTRSFQVNFSTKNISC